MRVLGAGAVERVVDFCGEASLEPAARSGAVGSFALPFVVFGSSAGFGRSTGWVLAGGSGFSLIGGIIENSEPRDSYAVSAASSASRTRATSAWRIEGSSPSSA